MSIIKSKHASNFTVLPNDIFEQGLSMTSIGLLSYLLHLPHDWVVHKTTLHKQVGMGPEKLDTTFKELQDKGYILSVKNQNSGTKMFEWCHVVYDEPFNGEKEVNSHPPQNHPMATNPMESTPLILNKELLSKQVINISFEQFWQLYEKKKGDKVQLERKWNKLTNEVHEKIMADVPRYKLEFPDPKFRKNPEAYLNKKAWEDERLFPPELNITSEKPKFTPTVTPDQLNYNK